MNGNDFLEIEEENFESIVQDYMEDILEGKEEIPDEYRFRWVEKYLEYD